MSAWKVVTAGTPGRWSVWRYNWLVHQSLIRALEKARVRATGVLLDVGCGSKPFAGHFRDRVTRYLGTDLASSRHLGEDRPDVFARAEALPTRDGSIDTMLSLSMLTYLPEPQRFVNEAFRSLRPGGVLILEFTQMAPVYDAPHDYFRFTRYGAEHLLKAAGFEPLDYIPIGGLMSRVGLTAIHGLNRINRGSTRVLTEIPVRLLYVVIQVGFAILDRLFFDPREVLAHIVVARRPR